MNTFWSTDVVVIGAGLAGLSCTWRIHNRSVAILRPPQAGSASLLARGGIAAAVGEDDAPEYHVADTVEAGSGLVDPEAARILAHEGLERMIDLFELSIDFDRDDGGRLQLGREALHSRDRVIHAAGDGTGEFVTHAVEDYVSHRDNISFIDGRALELVVEDGRVCGVVFADSQGSVGLIIAPCIVLATGGLGGLFERSTNPPTALGEGLAMAARAGARLVDLEFVQFHPTALDCDSRPLPLLSEAIRGSGARLIDEHGTPVMAEYPRGDLAGRDVVSLELWRRIKDRISPFLDVREIVDFAEKFPAAHRACTSAGIDPTTQPIPVTPAAHYHMGGVATDINGATSIAGLWAVGEVACTGAHGANRLASNSLLEALVFGARAGWAIAETPRTLHPLPLDRLLHTRDYWATEYPDCSDPKRALDTVRKLMWRQVGLERSETGLREALTELDNLLDHRSRHDPSRLAIEAARRITVSALLRTESRGAHYRVDHPGTDPGQARRLFIDQNRAPDPMRSVHAPGVRR